MCEQEVRKKDGSRVRDFQIQISISDIAPKDFVPESLRDQFVVISSEEICECMENAELVIKAREPKKGTPLPSNPSLPSPPDSATTQTLDENDERSIQEAENRANARIEEDDGD